MNYDYYAESRRLAAKLSDESLDDWALKILSAIEKGVTATEILMMLRWNLSNFLLARIGSDEVICRAKQLYQKINSVLS
jgi:hypothetical protein